MPPGDTYVMASSLRVGDILSPSGEVVVEVMWSPESATTELVLRNARHEVRRESFDYYVGVDVVFPRPPVRRGA